MAKRGCVHHVKDLVEEQLGGLNVLAEDAVDAIADLVELRVRGGSEASSPLDH